MTLSMRKPAEEGRLAGRRILVTGASSGIGRATAELFLAEGASLALFDMNGQALEAFADTGKVYCAQVDIVDDTALGKACTDAARFLGGLDGVVNAAGIMLTGALDELSIELWRKQIEVNLIGTYLVARNVVRWLKEQPSATIVNIASAAGLLSNAPGLSAYAASKGGVISMTRCLAAELAPAIRVNSVCPGMVDTPMADRFRANVDNYALKRLADPAEIASAILFLTSAESGYVTGSALAVDGGRSFH